MSPIFADLIHPPDQASLNYIHVKFRWGSEIGINEFQFRLTNENDVLIIDSLVTDTFLIITNEIEWLSTYHWKISPINGDWSTPYSFSTQGTSADMYADADNSFSVDIDPLTYNPEFSLDGITIYGIMDPYYSAAIDIEGNEIWNSDQYMFINMKENKEFFANSTFGGETNKEFGVQFSFEDDIVWNEPRINEDVEFLQHEIIKLPNGNYMGLVPIFFDHYVPHASNYPELVALEYEFYFADYFGGSSQFPCEWKTEKIVQWDSLGNEIWVWSPNDPGYGYNLNDFDEFNYWSEPGKNICFTDPFEWTHFNALAYDETDSSVYVSSKNLSRITKIDYDSTIIWNLGANLRWWEDLDLNHIIFGNSGQHSLQILPNGNIVTFDNGIGGQTDLSTALEIEITKVNDIYNADTTWSYTLPEDLYGTLSGNVQKLPNDNYLITTIGRSDGAYTIEVTTDKEIVWSCKYNVGLPMGRIYRAMRIPGLYESEFINSGPNLHILSNINTYSFSLNSIYPNPFNPIINIEYELSVPATVQLEIYNIRGQKIDGINDGYKLPGIYSVIWNGENYPSGLYVVTLKNQSTLLTKKMILLK